MKALSYVRGLVRVLVAVAVAAAAVSSGGCAAVVYKDAAASYVAASKDLTGQLNEVSSRLVVAEDMQRRQKIVTDPSCPIEQDRIFVRAGPSVRFTPLLQKMPATLAVPGCQQLVACEKGDASPACAHACYSAAEGNCLKIVEQEYARADAKRAGATSEELSDDTKRLVQLLHQVEYERGDALTSRLVADSLQALAQYMDLLEKASTAKSYDFTNDVTRVSSRIETITKGYEKITGETLSSADTATRDNITKTIGLLGTFGAHLKTLSENAKDAERIKAFVRNNKGLADEVIKSIENVVSGDDYLGVVLSNAAVSEARTAIAARYRAAGNPYDRGVLLDEALKYRYTTASASQKKLQDVFAALEQSHATLTRLVLDPDNAQLKAIHSEEFQNFRTVAQDVAGLIAQVAKF